jgi:NAD(P)H-dependent FMN reductase
MTITIIQGGPRAQSQTATVANFLAAQLNALPDVSKVEFLDIREYNFPVYGAGTPDQERLEEFRAALQHADGILIVSPEYNGRMPGALKNTLDYFRPEYAKKPMGVVTVSSGPFGGINAMHDLHMWMMYVGSVPLSSKLLVSNVGSVFNEAGEPQEFHFNKNYPEYLSDFMWLVRKIRS